MALRSSRLTQDQNFSAHFDGIKTNGSTVQKKKSGIGGRKALGDLTNSGKPSAFHTTKKQSTKNVIPIGEDLAVSKKAQNHINGRKALTDLTNSVKPISQQKSSKNTKQEKIPYSIAEEGFLHNHDECIKSKKKELDIEFDQFLKIIGLDEDVSCQSLCKSPPKKSNDENHNVVYEMDEIFEPISESQHFGQLSPICGSPNSPRIPYMNMMDYDNFPSFILAESPKK